MSTATSPAETPASPPEDLPAWSWWGMLGSALGAQLCCGLPWLLMSLGVGGSLITQLEALRPFRPLFVAAAFGFLIAGWLTWMKRRRKGCPLPRPKT